MAKKTDTGHKKSLHEMLADAGHVPHHALAERKDLSIRENKTEYRMQLSATRPTVSFQVDGKIITYGSKCDYVILIEHDSTSHNWTEVFVELKGTDVEHAIEQLETTLKAPVLKHDCIAVRNARIVALSFPSSKSNPAVEKAKRRFKSQYGCELKTVKSKQPDKIL